jgi:hypothetical protein
MALYIGVPQQRVGFSEHQIDGKRGQIDTRDARRLKNRLLEVRIGAIGDGFGIACD